jgi:hypothetical protein
MKRLNPKTQKPFKRGDMRVDGYIFNNYSSVLKKDGCFKEVWLTPEALKRRRQADSRRKMAHYVKKSTRAPKGSSWYFKRDDAARRAYQRAVAYISQCPDYSMDRLRELTRYAPFVLEIIFPTEEKLDYRKIFDKQKNRGAAFL